MNQMFGTSIRSKLKLIQRSVINHDCIFGKFKFEGTPIPLKIGNHLLFEKFIKTHEYPEGQLVRRKYTPISLSSQSQNLDFIFKIYRPNENVKFPHGGKLTPYIQKLKIGDTIDVEGPLGKFSYKKGFVKVLGADERPVKKLVLVAGGSGIAPIINILKQIEADSSDNIQLILLFANKSELGKRVKVHYIIDKPTKEGWKGHTGYVTKHILQQLSALDQADTFYASCGPRPMNQLIRSIIEEFPPSKYFKL